MTKAIIFDCFGVLASDGWLPFKAKHFGNNLEMSKKATELNKAVDSGELGFDEFMLEVAQLAGLTEQAARQQIENNIPDAKLFTLIQELKQTYRIGMLSNAGDNWLNDIFSPDQVALFDAVALSCEMGIVKPDPRTYEIIAQKLQVQTSECVFIDDQPKYIDGAMQTGMTAILYTNAEQLRKDLMVFL